MPHVSVLWNRGLQFVGLSETGHAVVVDAAKDAGGLGAAPSPTELLFIGLGACTAMDVVSILKKKRVEFDDLEIEVRGEVHSEPPKHVRTIHLVYKVSGRDVPEEAVRRAIELSQEKYCTVSNTVKGVAEVTWEFSINPADAAHPPGRRGSPSRPAP
jgi:putative redox protein